jgi:hypothetical protein
LYLSTLFSTQYKDNRAMELELTRMEYMQVILTS